MKRCAIYTRKSSEEGLDQAFNSLDAQREACGAYILSQTGEGWKALPALYDDGGFSGGSMERPALKRLVADVAAGKIDVVVVYKVDRLTRSLADFAKIVDVLDAAGASFVSVTQAFNTTTSMGRLTLNVLLSFAQFEREVTGERIRDKIAMSKAKGIWMGGMVPLGYSLVERRLVIEPAEAELIRRIFDRYLELGSVHRLRDELEEQGVRSKQWTTRGGRVLGGQVFNRSGVFHILRSRLYIGEIVHKGQRHPGLHPAIIDQATFDAVQARIDAQAAERKDGAQAVASSVLTGKIYDGDGEPMGPAFSYGRQSKAYRYYVTNGLQVGRKPPRDGLIRRVSADLTERFVSAELSRLAERAIRVADLATIVIRLELRRAETHLVVDGARLLPDRHPVTMLGALRMRGREVAVWEDEARTHIRVILPMRLKLRGGRVWMDGAEHSGQAAPSTAVREALRSAHRELRDLQISPLLPAAACAEGRAPETRYRRRFTRLTFLAPDLQKQLLQGHGTAGINLALLMQSDLPLSWDDQRTWFASIAAR